MDFSNLATVNAALNALATILLVRGFFLIKARKIEQHKKTMLAAFVTSVLFLISYLIYHARVLSVHFQGTGAIRTVYYGILGSHIILAAAVPFLAIVTLRRAFKNNFQGHRKLARWTFPIWLYVSVTGVIVYLMLYHL